MAGRMFHLDEPFLIVKREMDQLLNTFLGPESAASHGRGAASGGNAPGVNIWEGEEALFVELEVPGFTFDELDLTVVGRELTIKAAKQKAGSEEPGSDQEKVIWHRRERSLKSFSRIVPLPFDIRVDAVEANLRDGVLTIKLPKSEAAKARKIKVTG